MFKNIFWIWLTFRASLSDTGCTLRMDLLFFLVCFILVTSAGMAGTALLGISRFNLMLSVCSISMSLLKKLIIIGSTSLIKISQTLGGNSFANFKISATTYIAPSKANWWEDSSTSSRNSNSPVYSFIKYTL